MSISETEQYLFQAACSCGASLLLPPGAHPLMQGNQPGPTA